MNRIGIVAALRAEVKPLLDKGKWMTVAYRGKEKEFTILESERAVMICGGMGARPATIASEALLEFTGGGISLLVSAGLAGALVDNLRIGNIFCPAMVLTSQMDVSSGRLRTAAGRGGLITTSAVAGVREKQELHQDWGADAVDMEAFSVAQVAQAHGCTFVAVKAISDELGFAMPDMRGFIDEEGQFRRGSFIRHAALRPGIWPALMRLSRDSARAANSLCGALAELIASDEARRLELISSWAVRGRNAHSSRELRADGISSQ